MAITKGTDTYVAVSEADIYFSNRLDSSTWHESTVARKESALVSATRILDTMSWSGQVVDADQPLAFPRIGNYLDVRLGQWSVMDPAPRCLELATLELANHLLINPDLMTDTGSVKDLSVGSINLSSISRPSKLPKDIKRLVSSMLTNGNNGWWRAN